jgi:hypothetical protein
MKVSCRRQHARKPGSGATDLDDQGKSLTRMMSRLSRARRGYAVRRAERISHDAPGSRLARRQLTLALRTLAFRTFLVGNAYSV